MLAFFDVFRCCSKHVIVRPLLISLTTRVLTNRFKNYYAENKNLFYLKTKEYHGNWQRSLIARHIVNHLLHKLTPLINEDW